MQRPRCGRREQRDSAIECLAGVNPAKDLHPTRDVLVAGLPRLLDRVLREQRGPEMSKRVAILDPTSLWKVAEEAQMPLSLHIGTGKGGGVGDRLKVSPTGKRPPFMTRNYVNGIHEIQRSFTDILFGGVLERFPKLLLVSAENDSGWKIHLPGGTGKHQAAMDFQSGKENGRRNIIQE